VRVKINRRLGQNKSGTVLDLTIGEAEWLVGRRLATHVPDLARAPVADETEADDDLLLNATHAELKAKAEQLGIPSYGTKAQIQERITKARERRSSQLES
jgi:hypothetical protein